MDHQFSSKEPVNEAVRKARHICQVLHCQVDLAVEGRPYGLKRKCCMQHLKADAVMRKGFDGLWRFCFQCGKFQPLQLFTGNHRNCEDSLLKRQSSAGRKSVDCNRRGSMDSHNNQMTHEDTSMKEQQLSQAPQHLLPFLPCSPGSTMMLEWQPDCASQATDEKLPIWNSCNNPAVASGLLLPGSCKLPASHVVDNRDFQGLPTLIYPTVAVSEERAARAGAAAAAAGEEPAYTQLVDCILHNLDFDIQHLAYPITSNCTAPHQALDEGAASAALELLIEKEMHAAASAASDRFSAACAVTAVDGVFSSACLNRRLDCAGHPAICKPIQLLRQQFYQLERMITDVKMQLLCLQG